MYDRSCYVHISKMEAIIHGGPEPIFPERFPRNLELLKPEEKIDEKDIWYFIKYDPVQKKIVFEFPNNSDIADKLN